MDDLERARMIAVALEAELFALKQQLKQEREYCWNISRKLVQVEALDGAEMWEHAAHRIECIERQHGEVFGC